MECKQNNQETASLRAPRIIDGSGGDRRRADVDDDVEDAGLSPPVHVAAHTARRDQGDSRIAATRGRARAS